MPGIIVLAGKPKSGKSTLMAKCLEREYYYGSTVVIFDPSGDLAEMCAAEGVPNGENGSTNAIFVVAIGAPVSSARDAIARGERFIVFYNRDTGKMLALADAWLTVASDMQRGFVYACDEAELLLPNAMHAHDELGSRKAALLTIARNRGCRVYLATKRPQKLHIDARENATRVCVFRSDSESFLDGCANFGARKQFARAQSLDKGKYLYRGEFQAGGSEATLDCYDTFDSGLPFDSLLGDKP